MGEKIFDLIKELAFGKHSRKFWGVVILLVILFLIVFPYIDANFLYYSRIEKRITNLAALVELSGKTIEESPDLLSEYNNIINEINSAQTKNIGSLINKSPETNSEFWIKFVGGGFIFFAAGIFALFKKNTSEKYTFSVFLKNNFTSFVVLMVFGAFWGFLLSKIPTVGSAWINAVAAPTLEFVVGYLLFIQPKKK